MSIDYAKVECDVLRLPASAGRRRELGNLPTEPFPVLTIPQLEHNHEWQCRRERRIEQHAARVRENLRRHSRRKAPGDVTNGRRQAVWCVELHQKFDSLSDAARFLGRSAGNVLQAIRLNVRCGPYHWERFDPERHRQADDCDGMAGARMFIGSARATNGSEGAGHAA